MIHLRVLVAYFYDSEIKEFHLIGVELSNSSALNAVMKWSRDHRWPDLDWYHWNKDNNANRWTLGSFHIDECTLSDAET